jgi:drug/metabolite transporter (DMT)-like permease
VSGAALTATLPALLGVIALGEVPSLAEALGMAALTAGVWLAAGARLSSAAPLAPRGRAP